ncbi:MAG: endonuclease/exonuclease/phosphatase family protein [Phycisphaerales bacterium]
MRCRTGASKGSDARGPREVSAGRRARFSSVAFALAVAALLSIAAARVEPARISIGTFNIRYANAGDGANAWDKRREMVVAILKNRDVWGLQEALPEQVAQLRSSLGEFDVVARSREKSPDEGEACPILYRSARWRLDAEDVGTFWLSETPEVPGSKSWDSSLPRIATFARLIDKESNRALYVFNLHLDHQGANARLEAARVVAARIKGRKHADPVILLGDFNTGPATAPIRALLDDAALGLVDAWRVANPDKPERGSFNGWAETCAGDRIDFMLPSKSFAVESCVIDDAKPNGRWPSDHASVQAVLAWPPVQ